MQKLQSRKAAVAIVQIDQNSKGMQVSAIAVKQIDQATQCVEVGKKTWRSGQAS